MKQGIICGLTNDIADFENECSTYEQDIELGKKEEQLAVTRDLGSKVASRDKRFANHILDTIFLLIFNVVLGVLLGIILAVWSPDSLTAFEEDNIFINYFFTFVGGMIYYTFFEITTGRTLGKLITGTKVVDEQGNKPDAWTIFVRTLCRFIPFDAFSFLADDSGWHDTLSKTKVVEA
ncbi:RDD family protein [Aquimarina sp. 2201CG5-10]|uniref:RDD family protein n=1 Tax=Aquimarina callyspongiae TaxID=3098150 RepID=UPI002AB56E47|nr:RDD family protein [Aquimarina sp. 2201CG5-10]MDY8134083.1 RDD family protein [Aquimarina sp. 2201CG5-10]